MPPQPPEETNQRIVHSRVDLGPPPLSPLSSGGTLPIPKYPTLVLRKNSNTASAAFTSHRYRTDGALGLFHPKASPTSFHNLLVYGRHAKHLVKRWCLDWGSPLAHHQQAGVSVLPKR